MKTPVVFIIFKKINTTEKVFEVIRQVKPPKLLVIADGPRSNVPGEAEKCATTRAIIDRVDWDCEVLKNYADVNMGCKERVVSGLNWVFDTVEEAIILEDDCLPDPTFFDFCEELLERFRDDTRVMHITGTNFGITGRDKNESYYFSKRTDIWGWATWRRAWKYYDVNMSLWPEIKSSGKLLDLVNSKKEYEGKVKYWERHYGSSADAWSYQWHFACTFQGSCSLVPNKNLVRNIGFGEEALHTKNSNRKWGNVEIEKMEFPLVHPKVFIRDTQADDSYIRQRDDELSKKLHKRIIRKIKEYSGSIKLF